MNDVVRIMWYVLRQITIALLFAAFVCVDFALGQAADTIFLSLESAIQRSLAVSPEVGAVEADHDFARARSSLARASRFATEFNLTTAHAAAPGLNIPADNPYPTDALYLNPEVRNDWDDLRPFNRFETSLIQPIYTWGELGGSIRAARHAVDVEAAAVREKEIEVALRTAEAYYGLLLARALSRVAQEASSVVEQAQTEIRRLMEEADPSVEDADLFQVLITEQEVRARSVEVEQQQQTAASGLLRQLFLTENTVFETEDALLEALRFRLDSVEAYFGEALANRPEIARAAAGLAARGAQVEVARSDYFPKLFLGIDSRITLTEGRYRQPSPYVGDPFRGRSLRAGLGMRLQLNFAQTRARVRQAEAQRNQVQHQLVAARQLVLFEVEQAYRNVLTAQAAMEAQNQAFTLSREWLRTEQINFDLEVGDTQNLIRAVQASLELEASYLERIRRYNVAVLRLLAATGVLVEHAESGTLVD